MFKSLKNGFAHLCNKAKKGLQTLAIVGTVAFGAAIGGMPSVVHAAVPVGVDTAIT